MKSRRAVMMGFAEPNQCAMKIEGKKSRAGRRDDTYLRPRLVQNPRKVEVSVERKKKKKVCSAIAINNCREGCLFVKLGINRSIVQTHTFDVLSLLFNSVVQCANTCRI